MKTKSLTAVFVIASFFYSFSAAAQQKLKLELSYNVGIPLGSFRNDFIKDPSFRGGRGELSYAISPKFSLGLASGYQSYYQKYPRQTYKLDGNQVVSAVVTNTIEAVPLMLNGTYLPNGSNTETKIQPYLNAGAGINLVTYGKYLGEFGSNQTSTPLAATAGAGVIVPFGNRINQSGFKIGASYNYVGFKENGLDNLNNIGLQAGVIFALK